MGEPAYIIHRVGREVVEVVEYGNDFGCLFAHVGDFIDKFVSFGEVLFRDADRFRHIPLNIDDIGFKVLVLKQHQLIGDTLFLGRAGFFCLFEDLKLPAKLFVLF